MSPKIRGFHIFHTKLHSVNGAWYGSLWYSEAMTEKLRRLTNNQRQVYDKITSYIELTGTSPTLEELRQMLCSVRSTLSANTSTHLNGTGSSRVVRTNSGESNSSRHVTAHWRAPWCFPSSPRRAAMRLTSMRSTPSRPRPNIRVMSGHLAYTMAKRDVMSRSNRP